MSAFAAIFRRDRGRVSEPTLAALADPLAHRGPDGRDLLVDGALGVAHLHAWVTPEEVGERQPLRSGGRIVAFDGRIDNRAELIAALDLDPSGGAPSDARLILAAYEAWGDGLCRRLVGPFALALFDPSARRGLLARDALGDRTLFYADLGDELVVGSEEASLLAHPRVSSELDESTLARYFAVDMPRADSTFFRDVKELEPGRLLRVDERSISAESFWSPPIPGSASSVDSAELAERYRELLALAVSSRLRSSAPVAVMMSGGLDSTSIAAFAAEASDRTGADRPRAVSWVFDELVECDERSFIHPVVERSGLLAREFLGDGLGPLPDGHELCLNPSTPEESPYRRLKNRAYAEAVSAGSVAVLNGGSADALYTGYQRWFDDLIRAGSPVAAVRELAAEAWRLGPLRALRTAGLGRWARSLKVRRRSPRWLTSWAAGRLDRRSAPATIAAARIAAAAGSRAARSISVEVSYSSRAGVDLRHPYRDRRLVEFMVALPAHELYRHGRLKAIARRALEGRLPDAVRMRTERTRLTPLFDRALRGSNRPEWERLLRHDGAIWPRFVRGEWLEAALRGTAGPLGDAALWNCLALEIWRRRFGR